MIYAVAIVVGLLALLWSANRFIDSAIKLANYYKLPPLLIGIFIVGFGTSAPEMLVSLMASLNGNAALAVGNAVGSNIANIGFILGLTALISPIFVNSQIVKKELPILIFACLTAGAFLYDGSFSRLEALILLCIFSAIVIWSIKQSSTSADDSFGNEAEKLASTAESTLTSAYLGLTIGFVVLLASSRTLVWGAVHTAQSLGVSDLVIGLTIVALGTSLPELASSVAAALKKQNDIAIGNIVGSNMFNILAVLGLAGSVVPQSPVDQSVFYRDWSTMMILSIGLLVMSIGIKGQGKINRIEASLLLLVYFIYTLFLISQVLQ